MRSVCRRYNVLALAAGCVFLLSCHSRVNQVDKAEGISDNSCRYAKRFALTEGDGFTMVYLFGNRSNFDTTARFQLCRDTCRVIANARQIRIPCTNIAALSSIYAAMLCELGASLSIAAIDNIDYTNQPEVIDLFRRGKVVELAKGPEPDVEAVIALKPDILFMFGMGDGPGAAEKKLMQADVPLAVTVDHLEETPLARAEWIKFFGAFSDKTQEADSIFDAVEQEYRRLQELAASTETKPTVFSETKFGDIWYMPGGKSYMAQLLSDAGANYLWSDNNQSGSLPLSFEEVYQRAKHAGFWINLPLVKSRKQLLTQEPRYSEFNAYKSDNIYNNIKYVNAAGYSTYWETGMIHPERILSDLTQIFHPELVRQVKRELYYYIHLK